MEMKFPKDGSPHTRSNIRDFLGRSFRGEIKNGRFFFFFFFLWKKLTRIIPRPLTTRSRVNTRANVRRLNLNTNCRRRITICECQLVQNGWCVTYTIESRKFFVLILLRKFTLNQKFRFCLRTHNEYYNIHGRDCLREVKSYQTFFI